MEEKFVIRKSAAMPVFLGVDLLVLSGIGLWASYKAYLKDGFSHLMVIAVIAGVISILWVIIDAVSFFKARIYVDGDTIRETHLIKKPTVIRLGEIKKIKFWTSSIRSTTVLHVDIKSEKGIIKTDHFHVGFAKALKYLQSAYDRGLIPEKAVAKSSYEHFEDFYRRSPEGAAKIRKERK